MAFVAENGEGIPGANSLVSVADADEYHADRANTKWAALDEEKKQGALVRATDFVCRRYAIRWASLPMSQEQSLPFPRAGFVGVPMYVRHAVAEIAAIAAERPLLPGMTAVTRGSQIESTVGPITNKYAPLSVAEIKAAPNFDFIDDWLAPLMFKVASAVNFTVGRA